MSDINFLYLFTGCLDLALIAGQKKQRVPHAGNTCLEITPEIVLLILYTSQQQTINLLNPTSKVYPFLHLSLTQLKTHTRRKEKHIFWDQPIFHQCKLTLTPKSQSSITQNYLQTVNSNNVISH